MGESRQILTVSYGAFSCTLEGYDDPVVLLRAAAIAMSDLALRQPSFGSIAPAGTGATTAPPPPVSHPPRPDRTEPVRRSFDHGPPRAGRSPATKLLVMRNSVEIPGIDRIVAAVGRSARRAVARRMLEAPPDAPPLVRPAAPGPGPESAQSGATGGTPPRERDGSPPAAEPRDSDIPVSRLMDVADSKLSGADLKRRRDAISHVKAAVAATRANRPESRDAAPGMPPAEGGTAGPARVKTSSPPEGATPSGQAGGPGWEADEGEPLRESEIFEAFVWRAAPRGLEELLECAGAYAAFVRAQAHFSPPQLLHLLRLLDDHQALGTAEGMAAFTDLVDKGLFIQRGRDRFTLSQSSRFTPEGRQDVRAP